MANTRNLGLGARAISAGRGSDLSIGMAGHRSTPHRLASSTPRQEQRSRVYANANCGTPARRYCAANLLRWGSPSFDLAVLWQQPSLIRLIRQPRDRSGRFLRRYPSPVRMQVLSPRLCPQGGTDVDPLTTASLRAAKKWAASFAECERDELFRGHGLTRTRHGHGRNDRFRVRLVMADGKNRDLKTVNISSCTVASGVCLGGGGAALGQQGSEVKNRPHQVGDGLSGRVPRPRRTDETFPRVRITRYGQSRSSRVVSVEA